MLGLRERHYTRMAMKCKRYFQCSLQLALSALALVLILPLSAFAHDVSPEDAARIAAESGAQVWLYLTLGAKHMVTGYDHLLFLLGVIYYLRRVRDIALLVSLFALGHSITLILGCLNAWQVSPFLVDAVIGLSVAYKGFDNLGGFQSMFGGRPNERLAVFVFGLFHGLGLATKLQDLGLSPDGLLVNLVSFNLGVEIGQFSALLLIVLVLRHARILTERRSLARILNLALLGAGFALMTYQLGGYFA